MKYRGHMIFCFLLIILVVLIYLNKQESEEYSKANSVAAPVTTIVPEIGEKKEQSTPTITPQPTPQPTPLIVEEVTSEEMISEVILPVSLCSEKIYTTKEIMVLAQSSYGEDAPYTVEDVYALAKSLYGEGRGVSSIKEKAAIIWCILNRVDAEIYGEDIIEVITAPEQFIGYDEDHPVLEELVIIVEDVLNRWYLEKQGVEDVGRVLPADYLFFTGTGTQNIFRKTFTSTDYWTWSLEDVYTSESFEEGDTAE